MNIRGAHHSMRVKGQPSGRPRYETGFFRRGLPAGLDSQQAIGAAVKRKTWLLSQASQEAREGCLKGHPPRSGACKPGRSRDGANAVKADLARAKCLQATNLLIASEDD